jgi:hypothetical protein
VIGIPLGGCPEKAVPPLAYLGSRIGRRLFRKQRADKLAGLGPGAFPGPIVSFFRSHEADAADELDEACFHVSLVQKIAKGDRQRRSQRTQRNEGSKTEGSSNSNRLFLLRALCAKTRFKKGDSHRDRKGRKVRNYYGWKVNRFKSVFAALAGFCAKTPVEKEGIHTEILSGYLFGVGETFKTHVNVTWRGLADSFSLAPTTGPTRFLG